MSASWNLPDGCTPADIDKHFGSPPECSECGGSGKSEMVSDCCGDERNRITERCLHCAERCSPGKCGRCDGTGVEPPKEPDEREHDE